MKLIYVTNARLPTEKAHGLQIMKTCEALAKVGASVELIAPRRRNPLSGDAFAYYGIATRYPLRFVKTIDIPFGRIGFLLQQFSFALCAAFALKRERAEIIYSRDEVVLWLLRWCGFRNIVWESHTGAWNIAARSVARNASHLFVISNGAKDFYIARGIPEGNVTVIPSSYDPAQFAHPESKASARARLGLPLDQKIALYIGRLDGWKGSNTFLETSKLLDNVTVAVIGGEPKQIEALHAKYPKVRFLGFRPYTELADNQIAADVLVVPNTGKDPISVRFTSPLKVIAHLASGVPIVASDLPSIRELTGSDAAHLVAPDDPQALADGIRYVLEHPTDAAQVAAKALERVRAYTWAARADAILHALQNL